MKPSITWILASLAVAGLRAESKPSSPSAPTRAAVNGALTAGGKSIPLTHVAAWEVDSPSEKGQLDVVVVLSNRTLKRADALSTEALEKMMLAREITALRIVFDSDCRVRSAAPYHPSMRRFVSSGALLSWKPSAFNETTVAGRIFTGGTRSLAGEKWSYDLTFSTPIELDPEAKTVGASDGRPPEPAAPPAPQIPQTPVAQSEATAVPGPIGLRIDQSIESMGTISRIITRVGGSMCRTDYGKDSSTITATATGDTLNLLHGQRMVMRTSGARMRELTDEARRHMTAAQPVATGRRESIRSIPCDVYSFDESGTQTTLWIAPDYPGIESFKAALEVCEKGPACGLTVVGIKGLVLKSVTAGAGQTRTVTLNAINPATHAPDTFHEPVNYQLVGE